MFNENEFENFRNIFPNILKYLNYFDLILLSISSKFLYIICNKLPTIKYKKFLLKEEYLKIKNNLFNSLNILFPINIILYDNKTKSYNNVIKKLNKDDNLKKFYELFILIRNELNNLNIIKIVDNIILFKNFDKLINKIIYIDANKYRKLYFQYKDMINYQKILIKDNEKFNFDVKKMFFPPYSIEFNQENLYNGYQ